MALVLAWTAILCFLASVMAQVQTSNGTLPTVDLALRLVLLIGQTGMDTKYEVQLANASNQGVQPSLSMVDVWSSSNSHKLLQSTELLTILQHIRIHSSLVLTTPFNINKLDPSSIAYVSCDAADYSGSQLNAPTTIALAAGRVNTQSSDSDPRDSAPRGAVIIFSTTNEWCNYTQPPSLTYPYIFTMTSAYASMRLHDALAAEDASAAPSAVLTLNQTVIDGNPFGPNGTADAGNGTGPGVTLDAGSGPAPTTPIAMIVLYVVTGVVSLFFMAIITMGALRARRYPDRYGPGRGRGGRGGAQTRIGGLARATVHALPIVKFGAPAEDPKRTATPDGGVEMAQAPRGSDNAHGALADGSADESAQSDAPRDAPTDAATPATSPAPAAPLTLAIPTAASPTGATAPSSAVSTAPPTAFEDVTCSICTEDFVAGEDLRVLPCNHRFHPACVDPWLVDFSGVCPNCRVDLKSTLERLVSDTGREGPGSADGAGAPGGGPGSRGTPSDGIDPSAELLELLGMNRAEIASLDEERMAPEQRRELLRRLARWRRDRATGAGGARRRVSQRLSRLVRRSRVGDPRGGEDSEVPPVPETPVSPLTPVTPVGNLGGESESQRQRVSRETHE